MAQPQLRLSVLAALRLSQGAGHLTGGRLITLLHDGAVREIISHGVASQDEAADRAMAATAVSSHQPVRPAEGQTGPTAWPLGKDKRIHGVLILDGTDANVGALLADLLLQWCALAEFVNLEKEELIDENYQLREEIRQQFSERNIVAVSGAFRHVLDNAKRVAASNATVLIEGETGTGKEMVARLIHDHSQRANGPFVAINCGSLSESLLESELFGHVKGAFTGAVNDRKGRFEAANSGTIFLDEIGEVSPAMQVRLLRVLQEMEVERVGDNKVRKLDVRVVAATNRHLETEIGKGTFRADLYYRLNVVYLHIPPLRSRSEDIPHLVERFLSLFCQRNAKYIEAVSREVLDTMRSYPWPGNVRELENCIEKMVVMAPGKELTPDLLPMAVAAFDPHQETDRPHGMASFELRLKSWCQAEVHAARERDATDLYDVVRAKWDRHLLEATLDSFQGNKSKAARMLGLSRNTLATRLGELSIVKREWAVE